MITKERLEELIEQGATIYRTYANCDVLEYKLDKTYIKVDYAFLWKKLNGAIKSVMYPLDQLFETREEAEWHEEFGCIERTERLELPTWEEFSKLKSNHIRFISKKGANCKIEGYCDDGSGFIDIVCNGSSMLMVSDYSKETYINACRKAKELFLGEKK